MSNRRKLGSGLIGSKPHEPGLSDERDMPQVQLQRLRRLAEEDVLALAQAHQKYGDSWRKKGGIGAYFTLSRKIDRYERACEQNGFDLFQAVRNTPASDGTVQGKDGLLDDVRDLRRYLSLVEEYLTREAP